jgi:hypothetical protein
VRLKKTWFAACAVFLFPCLLSAGDLPFNFGFSGGVNFGYMEGSEIDALELTYGHSASTITSGNGGLRFTYVLQKWLKVESGLHLSGNGFELLLASESGIDWSSGTPRSVETNLYSVRRVRTLEIPFSFRVQTPCFSKENVSLYAMAGLRMGFVVKAIEKLVVETIASNFPDQGESSDRDDLSETDLFQDRIISDTTGHQIHYTYDDFYRSNDLSYTFGAGIEKRYKNAGFFLEGHYQHGLLNFNNLSDRARKEIAQFGSDSGQTNIVLLGEPDAFFRTIQFSAGVTIYLQAKKQPGKSKL